jgi:CDP-6-deoxy-D-xylo-4-hexulose-3-dehydrase
MLRSHGWPKDLPEAEQTKMADAHGVMPFNRTFTFYVPGFNVRSTDLNARIGLSQMKKADRVVARRVENHKTYQARFAGAPGLQFQESPRSTISSISFCALATSPRHRDRIAAALREGRIETRPIGGGNMSRQPFWAQRFGSQDFRVADRIHTAGFQLPNHPGLSSADINHIADTVLGVKAE